MQEVVNADPLVHDALVELLLPRLCHYFESDQSLPPIVLDRCASLQVGLNNTLPLHSTDEGLTAVLTTYNSHCRKERLD